MPDGIAKRLAGQRPGTCPGGTNAAGDKPARGVIMDSLTESFADDGRVETLFIGSGANDRRTGTDDIGARLDEKSGAGLYVMQAGRFSYADQRFAAALGYESPRALIGKSFWEIVHPDDQKAVTEEITRQESVVAVHPPIFRLFDRNKKMVWVQMRGNPVL